MISWFDQFPNRHRSVAGTEKCQHFTQYMKVKLYYFFFFFFFFYLAFECHQLSTNKMERHPTEVTLMYKNISDIFFVF